MSTVLLGSNDYPNALNRALDRNPASIEWTPDVLAQPNLADIIRGRGGLPNVGLMKAIVGCSTLQCFVDIVSMCPNLEQLDIRSPEEGHEINEYAIGATVVDWRKLCPKLTSIIAPTLLIAKLVPGRPVYLVESFQAEREDSDVMLKHSIRALASSRLTARPVTTLHLRGIAVPFMRTLLAVIFVAFPQLRVLHLHTDGIDDSNNPPEKYPHGRPDETYEDTLMDVLEGAIDLPKPLIYLEILHRSAFRLDYEPLARLDYSKLRAMFPKLEGLSIGVIGHERNRGWSSDRGRWLKYSKH